LRLGRIKATKCAHARRNFRKTSFFFSVYAGFVDVALFKNRQIFLLLKCMNESLAPLGNREIRKLKADAQRLKPILKIGKGGMSPQFVQSVEAAFASHELIKIKFDDFKEQKKTLAPELAAKTSSHLVTLLGNVVVLYRPKRTAADETSTDEDRPQI